MKAPDDWGTKKKFLESKFDLTLMTKTIKKFKFVIEDKATGEVVGETVEYDNIFHALGGAEVIAMRLLNGEG